MTLALRAVLPALLILTPLLSACNPTDSSTVITAEKMNWEVSRNLTYANGERPMNVDCDPLPKGTWETRCLVQDPSGFTGITVKIDKKTGSYKLVRAKTYKIEQEK